MLLEELVLLFPGAADEVSLFELTFEDDDTEPESADTANAIFVLGKESFSISADLEDETVFEEVSSFCSSCMLFPLAEEFTELKEDALSVFPDACGALFTDEDV